ncbi:MAG: hypothetical protein IPJ13_20100 [Saprospiraceae bacterium]|nr:hypothetical protein [Saprospiraceae bacterium]
MMLLVISLTKEVAEAVDKNGQVTFSLDMAMITKALYYSAWDGGGGDGSNPNDADQQKPLIHSKCKLCKIV